MDAGAKGRSARWPLATAAAGMAIIVGGVLALASLDDDPSAPERMRHVNAVAGICAAAGAADANNRIEVRQVYFADVDERLERLARRTAERDRSVAQRLLRAEERVEANLQSPRAGLVEDLVDLADATRAALRAVGDFVPPPCELDDR